MIVLRLKLNLIDSVNVARKNEIVACEIIKNMALTKYSTFQLTYLGDDSGITFFVRITSKQIEFKYINLFVERLQNKIIELEKKLKFNSTELEILL